SGLKDLFDRHGLSSRFLAEQENGLYPDSDDLVQLKPAVEEAFELCPNPWSTLFVAENGDVHLCFLAQPVGNLYRAPVLSTWNSPEAIAKRSDMISGRYMQSGCSRNWCSWREGKAAVPPDRQFAGDLESLASLEGTGAGTLPVLRNGQENRSSLGAIRRLFDE